MGLFDRFKTPKWQHKDSKVRLEAVKELNDDDILVDIAKNDSDTDVRKTAISRISDEQFLFDIAKNDKDPEIREIAFQNITDQSLLADIAKNDSEWSLRFWAVVNINDVSILLDIANNDSVRLVRCKAIENIKDVSILSDIAMNGTDTDNRRCAIKNISNEAILVKIIKNTSNSEVWKEAIKKYKVTFELEGKEETFELEKLDEDVTGYLKFEDREGYEIRWYVGDEEYDFSTPLTKDVKLTGKYVQTSSYTITFDSDGGNKIDSQKIGVGEKVKEPKAPTKKGYIFDGWYYNNAKYDFNATVKRSMKLVAHWKEDPNVKRFKVTFNTDSGTPVPPTQTVMDGDKATKPANPTKKGFVFVDWELNGTVYNFNLAVKADIELKAKWREAEVYKVTFPIK